MKCAGKYNGYFVNSNTEPVYCTHFHTDVLLFYILNSLPLYSKQSKRRTSLDPKLWIRQQEINSEIKEGSWGESYTPTSLRDMALKTFTRYPHIHIDNR